MAQPEIHVRGLRYWPVLSLSSPRLAPCATLP